MVMLTSQMLALESRFRAAGGLGPNPAGALDAAPYIEIGDEQERLHGEALVRLMNWVSEKLDNTADMTQFTELLDAVTGNAIAGDSPEPFPGMPIPGGRLEPLKPAMDARTRRLRREAEDRASFNSSAAAAGFAKRFPNASRIGNL